ncbi:hypothetical protein [Actinomadura sp. GTD37]|uniref:DUF6197 family protein n=1 Tax=Actinomadura sp. GTD37 TaxID=1778030 RepID=UPI0035BFCE51
MTADTTTLLPSALLYGAADIVAVRGLAKDDWIAPGDPSDEDYDEADCPVCVLASINLAAGRYHSEPLCDVTLDAAEAVAAHLGLDHLIGDVELPHDRMVQVLGAGWNDVPDRTEGDVVRVLRGAARKEAEAGR